MRFAIILIVLALASLFIEPEANRRPLTTSGKLSSCDTPLPHPIHAPYEWVLKGLYESLKGHPGKTMLKGRGV